MTCPQCDGAGEACGAPVSPVEKAICMTCNGTGEVTVAYDALIGDHENECTLDCGCVLRREYEDTSVSITFCQTHKSTFEMWGALEAIKARINGEWDHPALVAIGALHTNPETDCLRIAEAAIAKAKGEQ